MRRDKGHRKVYKTFFCPFCGTRHDTLLSHVKGKEVRDNMPCACGRKMRIEIAKRLITVTLRLPLPARTAPTSNPPDGGELSGLEQD